MQILQSLPAHRAFLERALAHFKADPRIVGVAAAGSLANGRMDEFSDLDLVIVVEPEAIPAVMTARQEMAAALGPLVAAFTGEHVGEPRLLICLYAGEAGALALHVDLKFVALPDAAQRVDEPLVLWARDGRLGQVLQTEEARYPAPDLAWIEARIWVWVHYAVLKIGRGEWFEAMDFLAYLRTQVLGPLALQESGAQPAGVRRVEVDAPTRVPALRATVATPDRESCLRGLHEAVALYRSLRAAAGPDAVVANTAAESVAMACLDDIAARLPAQTVAGAARDRIE